MHLLRQGLRGLTTASKGYNLYQQFSKAKPANAKGTSFKSYDIRTRGRKLGGKRKRTTKKKSLKKRVKELESKTKMSTFTRYKHDPISLSSPANLKEFQAILCWDVPLMKECAQNIRMVDPQTNSVVTTALNLIEVNLKYENYSQLHIRNNYGIPCVAKVYLLDPKISYASTNDVEASILRYQNDKYSSNINLGTYGVPMTDNEGFRNGFTLVEYNKYMMEPGDHVTCSTSKKYSISGKNLDFIGGIDAKYSRVWVVELHGAIGHDAVGEANGVGPVACQLDGYRKSKIAVHFEGSGINESAAITNNFDLTDQGETAGPSIQKDQTK